MPRTERRIRIEQRSSDRVHRKSYSNGKVQRVPCRYCGRSTVEGLMYSAHAGCYLGYCHRCQGLLAGEAESLLDDFRSSGCKQQIVHTRLVERGEVR